LDHRVHLIDVRLEQRLRCADAGTIHEQRDPRVGAQTGLDPGEIFLVTEIGGNGFDRTPGAGPQSLRQAREAVPVAGDQDQVVAALCKPVGVDRADPGGGAGHQRRALRGSSHDGFSLVGPTAAPPTASGNRPFRGLGLRECIWLY
jgi:hypothetical protein